MTAPAASYRRWTLMAAAMLMGALAVLPAVPAEGQGPHQVRRTMPAGQPYDDLARDLLTLAYRTTCILGREFVAPAE